MRAQLVLTVPLQPYVGFHWGLAPHQWHVASAVISIREATKATPEGWEGLQLQWLVGHTPSAAGTFRKKFRKISGETPETLSERFLEIPSRVRLGSPKPYNSRHLKAPEHFQDSLPPSTAGDASFFRSGSGKGLSELVMEFPAVLGAFLSSPSMVRAHFQAMRMQCDAYFLCQLSQKIGLCFVSVKSHHMLLRKEVCLPEPTLGDWRMS